MQNSAAHHEAQSPVWISEGSVKKAIVSLVMALEVDYAAQFKSAYGTDEQVRAFKNRLLEEFRGAGAVADDVVNGYEAFISVPENAKFMPTLPQLLQCVGLAKAERLAKAKRTAEAESLVGLPAPKMVDCNPLAMLASAKADGGKRSKAELLAEHEALINAHAARGLVRMVRGGAKDRCTVAGCHAVGSVSAGQRGGGNFYCVDHARMMV